jgi:hypothetical protein
MLTVDVVVAADTPFTYKVNVFPFRTAARCVHAFMGAELPDIKTA